jgi:hypothetical protein
MIEPIPIDWEVSLRVDILENGGVKQIEFYVFIPESEYGDQINSNDLKDGVVQIFDSSDTPTGVFIEKWKPDEWEGWVPGWWYRGDVVSNDPLTKGDFFYIEFTIPYPQFDECAHLPGLPARTFYMFQAYHIARGDMPGENTYAFFPLFQVGPKYSDTPPQFMIPELPLGTFTALTTSLIVLILYARKNNQYN